MNYTDSGASGHPVSCTRFVGQPPVGITGIPIFYKREYLGLSKSSDVFYFQFSECNDGKSHVSMYVYYAPTQINPICHLSLRPAMIAQTLDGLLNVRTSKSYEFGVFGQNKRFEKKTTSKTPPPLGFRSCLCHRYETL